jgi:hypothetical protein
VLEFPVSLAPPLWLNVAKTRTWARYVVAFVVILLIEQ